jgi:rhamnosyltransferase
MLNKTVDVIVPTYKPDAQFRELLKRLHKQEYPIRKILIMNTGENFWDPRLQEAFPDLEVHHIRKSEFDHGGTRKEAARYSDAQVLVYMTQDALPADPHLIGKLVEKLYSEPDLAACYARQLPKDDCGFLERYTRSFNYPDVDSVKRLGDLPRYGIKTYFCSNVCAAYRRDLFEANGGFVPRTIFNEDMIYAGSMIQKGYGIAYAAQAKVLHSHNYTAMQQFKRNFDLGVSQAEHPEIFRDVPSEGEGFALVKKSFCYLLKQGRFYLIPKLIIQSGCKYAGYLLGKNFRRLPHRCILACTMMQDYWR